MSSIVYLEIQGHEMHNYKEQIEDLLSIYYKNPHDIFEMIKRDRIFFTAWSSNSLIGFYCCKHHPKDQISVVAYLGLITVHPQYHRITGFLVFRHLEYLNRLKKRIYCYTITANPVVYKIAKRFYQNIYPENFLTLDQKRPEHYNCIAQISSYEFAEKNPYIIINSPSVARYNQKFRRKLKQKRLSRNTSNCTSFLDEEKGERLLILCEYQPNEKFDDLRKIYQEKWVNFNDGGTIIRHSVS